MSAEAAPNPNQEPEATFENSVTDLNAARKESMSSEELTAHARDRIQNMVPGSPEEKAEMKNLQDTLRDRAKSEQPHSGELQNERDAA